MYTVAYDNICKRSSRTENNRRGQRCLPNCITARMWLWCEPLSNDSRNFIDEFFFYEMFASLFFAFGCLHSYLTLEHAAEPGTSPTVSREHRGNSPPIAEPERHHAWPRGPGGHYKTDSNLSSIYEFYLYGIFFNPELTYYQHYLKSDDSREFAYLFARSYISAAAPKVLRNKSAIRKAVTHHST